ncbi:S41 family peptidase [Maricaulis sp.]|uniref:S41 family peptidase n=1 Tax=Maricaulis sp. TaxID=1486257 RepID=UPI002B267F1E|nr:S41 family peptidase [Maricaulis sp.]
MFAVFLASTALSASPACVTVFDEVDAKIESNYVARALYAENAPALAAAAEANRSVYRAQASGIASDDVLECTRVLQGYVRSHEDPHLFLNATPALTEADIARRRAGAARIALPPQLLRQQARSATGRGPLVGVWAADDFEAAIIPEADGGFVAVVVDTDSDDWTVGDIAARFENRNGVAEAIRYRAEDRAPIRTGYSIASNAILSMAPVDWGRIAPAPGEVIGEWDPRNPRRPRFEMLNADVAWLSIPSFSPALVGDSLQMIADNHRDDILGAELLVVDLRGNHGGSASAIAPLDPFIMTHDAREDYQPDPYSPVLLSSPDTIRYYAGIVDRMQPGLEQSVFADLVQRLESNPGSLVPMLTEPAHIAFYNDARVPDDLFDQPTRVAILVDADVMSAGEAVLLRAGRSTRVTSFGAPTRGSIDYQNVLMTPVGAGDLRFSLGYPLIADNPHLPVGGFNQNGVPVDVPLQGDPESWPQQILDHYNLR